MTLSQPIPPHVRSSSPIPLHLLSPGDFVSQSGSLHGEPISLVSASISAAQPANEFQVVRVLGSGSYAVVYLVREVLYRPPQQDDSLIGELDLDTPTELQQIEYGGDYAIKCLSKDNLDPDALAAQMAEVTIHQSLLSHPNIATLHRTLETSSYLLLILEYVPGEDLFYFLEQARDHYDPFPDNASHTPPTPSLLSSLNPAQLLSRSRLRLIASMFSQMCEAVAACHIQQVFHRDIKPENFIVTDGWSVAPDGSPDRKVIVKLSDFGLSTTDVESSDMDCGSAPYMSYECRNNTAPSYRPRGADVWSLGIVLINMLYHTNPWSDTTQCPSFDLYCQQPVQFFMQRFAGMTEPVAEYLTTKVFCLLDDPKDDSPRALAKDFGAWVRDLPDLLGSSTGTRHRRAFSNGSTQGHPLSHAILQSHRPSSRQATHAYLTTDPSELSTVYDQEQDDPLRQPVQSTTPDCDSRSTSTYKRRKRGRRKGGTPSPMPDSTDDRLDSLASQNQTLVRELSRTSQASSRRPPMPPTPPEPMPIYQHPLSALSAPSVATIAKKQSKWKFSLGRSTGEDVSSALDNAPAKGVVTVSNYLMGLSAPPPTPPASSTPKADADASWKERGRPSARKSSTNNQLHARLARGRSAGHALSESGPIPGRIPYRPLTPTSTRSGRATPGASSITSSNWRSSMSTTSSAGNSTVFTRFSNSSVRSVSTTATSASADSWRSPRQCLTQTPPVPPIPENLSNGTKYEAPQVDALAQMFLEPHARKPRTRKPKDVVLDTISERPGTSGQTPSVSQRRDAMTSTTDLSGTSEWIPSSGGSSRPWWRLRK